MIKRIKQSGRRENERIFVNLIHIIHYILEYIYIHIAYSLHQTMKQSHMTGSYWHVDACSNSLRQAMQITNVILLYQL